ncbi:hypothetical protein ACIRBX_33805 [Kitasatospora sp. NPDC096147]|uniref:hypothetical protein n=1 Tax=Kitasatospora sp. NPDC096147 TaxID=3364093 RepID=UPI0037FB7368
MPARHPLHRTAPAPGRAVAVLTANAVVLGTAFVLAPARLAAIGSGGGLSERQGLARALGPAFAAYWESGGRAFPPDLARVVDYWARYHVVKAVLAAALLLVLAALVGRLRKAFLRPDGPGPGLGRGRRAGWAAAGVLAGGAALAALAAVMANIQGAAAPFSSLLPMLTSDGATRAAGATGTPDRIAGVTEQIRQGLAHYPGTGSREPGAAALRTMVEDFGHYHAVLAVTAAVVAVGLAGLSVLSWRRLGTAGAAGDDDHRRRVRRTAAVLGTLLGVLAVGTAVVAAANTGTASNPAPALLAFWEGSW